MYKTTANLENLNFFLEKILRAVSKLFAYLLNTAVVIILPNLC